MNQELIGWAIVFFIVWELCYIWFLKNYPYESKQDDNGRVRKVRRLNTWVELKTCAFALAVLFFFIEILIISNAAWDDGNTSFTLHYERLFIEVGAIFVLWIFTYLNKSIHAYYTKDLPKTKKGGGRGK